MTENNFWLNKAEKYSDASWGTNLRGTHPNIVKFINKYASKEAKTILDYGCGDGSLIQLLN